MLSVYQYNVRIDHYWGIWAEVLHELVNWVMWSMMNVQDRTVVECSSIFLQYRNKQLWCPYDLIPDNDSGRCTSQEQVCCPPIQKPCCKSSSYQLLSWFIAPAHKPVFCQWCHPFTSFQVWKRHISWDLSINSKMSQEVVWGLVTSFSSEDRWAHLSHD